MPNRDIYTKLGTSVKRKSFPSVLFNRFRDHLAWRRFDSFGLTKPQRNIYTNLGIFSLRRIHQKESVSPSLRNVPVRHKPFW